MQATVIIVSGFVHGKGCVHSCNVSHQIMLVISFTYGKCQICGETEALCLLLGLDPHFQLNSLCVPLCPWERAETVCRRSLSDIPPVTTIHGQVCWHCPTSLLDYCTQTDTAKLAVKGRAKSFGPMALNL